MENGSKGNSGLLLIYIKMNGTRLAGQGSSWDPPATEVPEAWSPGSGSKNDRYLLQDPWMGWDWSHAFISHSSLARRLELHSPWLPGVQEAWAPRYLLPTFFNLHPLVQAEHTFSNTLTCQSYAFTWYPQFREEKHWTNFLSQVGHMILWAYYSDLWEIKCLYISSRIM